MQYPNESASPQRRFATFLLVAVAIYIAGCSEEKEAKFPSAEGKAPPYILKEGCTFSIVEENSRSSIESPKVSGVPGTTASASVSLGDMSITVADCRVTENPNELPIYED